MTRLLYIKTTNNLTKPRRARTMQNYFNDTPKVLEVTQNIIDKAKIMWINYPNNPTGAIAGEDFFSPVSLD